MNDKIDVSIIMLGYNQYEEYTKPAIDDILTKTQGVIFELIVVDNGSTDGTGGKLVSYSQKDSRLKPVLLRENLGFSGGNNEGYRHAKGEFVIFINNDILVKRSDWLKRFVDLKRKSPFTIFGGKMVSGNLLTEWRGRALDYLEGWCIFGAKEDFDKLLHDGKGPWEVDFGKAFFEDGWMNVSLVHKGFRLEAIDPGIEHLGSKTVSKMKDIDEVTAMAQKVWRNKLALDERGDKLRVVFVFNDPNNDFNDESYETRGVGGADATLILLTRELAKRGHIVEVYNGTKREGCFKGVYWYNLQRIDPDVYADIYILYRNYHHSVKNMYCGTKIFFSHDQWTSMNWETDIFPFVDRMFCVSPFHKNYILKHYSIPAKKIDIMYNGLNGVDYEAREARKVPGKMIFCSVPKRGLDHLLEWFPDIKYQVPNASLWITSDYTLWGSKDPDNAVQKQTAENMSAYGIHYLGNIPRSELVKHQLESEIMAYTCNYEENFCISAIECMAAACVPVTSDIGSMKFTVGDGGVVIPTVPSDPAYRLEFVKTVVALLNDAESRHGYALRGIQRAQEFDWRTLVEDYEKKFYSLKKEVNMHDCNICNKSFPTAFELMKHRAQKHPMPKREVIELDKTITYQIETDREVMVSIGQHRWEGRKLEVPYEYAGEVVRILTEAYGPGVVVMNRIRV